VTSKGIRYVQIFVKGRSRTNRCEGLMIRPYEILSVNGCKHLGRYFLSSETS
jgi:hypothetical protein